MEGPANAKSTLSALKGQIRALSEPAGGGGRTPRSPRLPFPPTLLKPDFEALRIEGMKRGVVFSDPEFPAKDTSMYFSCHPPYKIHWMRPSELTQKRGLKPQLMVNTSPVFNVKKGELGDYWLTAALACLFDEMELLYQLMPHGQSFQQGWYSGIFRFQFWRYDVWEEVVVDDQLPTVGGELVAMQCWDIQEFWPALLEKAYAKLHGSYEALKSGSLADVLHELTGGLVESYQLRDKGSLPKNFINCVFKALEKQSIVACGLNPIPGRPEAVLANGLETGVVYTVTDIREIRMISERGEVPITLIRLRNPRGHKVHWNGPWSERSPEMSNISQHDRQVMGLICRDEGEFWMDFKDFINAIDTIDICHLPPTAPITVQRKWKACQFHGRWKKGVNAGGRPVCSDTHWMNPQYRLSLVDGEEDEGGLCTCLIELSQKDRRRIKHRGMPTVDVGFVVYKVTEEYPLPLSRPYFGEHNFVARCAFFCNARQMTRRLLLPPGDYIVIPSTYEVHTEADFMLRVFFESDSDTADFVDEISDIVEFMAAPTDPQLKKKEDQFQKFFYDAAGENMEIDVFQFRRILNAGLSTDPNHRDIKLDACKALLLLVDVDNSTKLGYYEFIYLWNLLNAWKGVFEQFDPRHGGSVDASDLRPLVSTLGYRLSCEVTSRLIFRFANDKCQMDFDDVIICMVKVVNMFNVFKAYETKDQATFTLEEWLEASLVL